MPYEWVPAPSNPNLKVIKDLPKGAKVSYKTASLGDKTWHKCYGCCGWIEGEANKYHEDTIGPLCGERAAIASGAGWRLTSQEYDISTAAGTETRLRTKAEWLGAGECGKHRDANARERPLQ